LTELPTAATQQRNTLGFIIVGMFLATWMIALAIWRFGRIEERWSAHLSEHEAAGQAR
jgi:nickel/cobalt transporter (NiCoT) family protein